MIQRQNDTIHVCFGITAITSVWSYETATATTVINIMSSIIATVSNLTILIVLVGNKRLRSPPYLLLGGLCFSDLLVGLVIQPMAVIQRFNEINNRANCDFTLVFRYFQWLANSVSMFLINLVTIDRYYAIRYPFRYPDFATSRRYTLFMIIIWLLCACLLIVPYIWRSLQLFNLIFILIVIGMTVTLSLFCYSKIYIVIIEQGRKITQTTLVREHDDISTEQQDTQISNHAVDGKMIELEDKDRAKCRQARLKSSHVQWPDIEHIIQGKSSKEIGTSSGNGTRSIGNSNMTDADKKVERGDSVYCKQPDSQGESNISHSGEFNRGRLEAARKGRSGGKNHYVREPTEHKTGHLNKDGSKEITGDDAPSSNYLTVQGGGERHRFKSLCGGQDISKICTTHVHASSSTICWLEATNEEGAGHDNNGLAVIVGGEETSTSDYLSKSDNRLFLAVPKNRSQSEISSSSLTSSDCLVPTNTTIQTTINSVQNRRPLSQTLSFRNINSRLINRLKNVSNTKRETKKTYTVILLFLTIFLSYMPLFIISLAVGRYSRYTYNAFTWGETVAFLSSSVNPIIYCFRMKDIREAVKDLIRRRFQCRTLFTNREEKDITIKVPR